MRRYVLPLAGVLAVFALGVSAGRLFRYGTSGLTRVATAHLGDAGARVAPSDGGDAHAARAGRDPLDPGPGGEEEDEADDGDRALAPADEGLKRSDVLAALGAVEQRVLACYGPEGRGSVKLTVASSGRVIGAKVQGPLGATRAGDCVEAAARDASFRANRREITQLVWTLPMHAR